MFTLNPFSEDTVTPLRQRMIQDLQLRGYSDRTVEAYVRSVAQLARFYHASPDTLTEEQLRDYLLHLATVQKVARGTHTIALCGLKFFYQQTLGREWTVLKVARPKGETKLPVFLSREEVWRILDRIRIPVYRVCLTTIYACGLRLLEGARLQVPDVDGARKVLHGHFARRAGPRCHPLTIVDSYSRYLLACQALPHPSTVESQPVFRRLFQEYGLPERIRTDNGAPFATTTLCRLSDLSVWWLKLGIRPELIQPASPQQNARHERMHHTLKAEATRPPAASLAPDNGASTPSAPSTTPSGPTTR